MSATVSKVSRAENVARAQALRAEDLLLREIAAEMGAAKTTVHAWLADPDLSKQRARRERYAVPCSECGGPTNGSGGYKHQVTICQSCRDWTEDEIIAAMRRWADEHGGIPPSCADWRAALPGYPHQRVAVIRRVGWNNLLRRAGLVVRCNRDPEHHQWIVEQIRAGRLLRDIAAEIGTSPQAISNRLRWRGTSVAAIRAQVTS